MSISGPLRILVVGDFSGRSTGRLLRIDRDNLEAALREFSPLVELGQMGEAELVFRSMADFEPDTIYRTCDLFAPLRNTSGTQLYSEPEEGQRHVPLQPTPEQMAKLTGQGGLLDAIIDATPAQRTEDFGAMVERIVAPYKLPAESAQSKQAAIERQQRISLLLRHILHDAQFQALESAWRGLDWLVRGLETDSKIHLFLFDITKESLAAELQATSNLRNSIVYHALAAGQEPWGLVAANFGFDRDSLADVETLGRIGNLAQALGAPVIAEWQTSPQENAAAEEAWRALRKSPTAEYLALALPRFLLRLPYGKETVTLESLEFEEMPGTPQHNEYLWANPAFACALVLGQLYEHLDALAPTPGFLKLTDLPLHVFTENGETHVRPCTEVLLSDNDYKLLLEEGVLPLVAAKASDEILFPRIQSIAEGGKLMAGLAEQG